MSRATDDVFDALHALTAETLMEEVRAYRERKEPVPPALIAQVLKFMKDNGIDSPQRAQNVKDSLANTLPTFDDVADNHDARH